jgi:tetratricopeptide (TPR) repeat protein
LDAIDATLYTSARAQGNDFEAFSDIVVPSMLLKVASAAYHERDWKAARDFSIRATSADPKPDRGWIILAKAYIRLAYEGAAEWSQAEAVLAKLKERGHRAQHYIAGFLSWKRGDLTSAVECFRRAENAGDRGVAVYRDRAHCEYQLGRVEDAATDIKVALDRYPRNPFVVDLAAAIAIKGGKYQKAAQFLKELQELEPRREHYHHRLATLYAAKKQFPKALVEANLAAERQPPLHEILTNRIDILIELTRYSEALSELAKVEQQFKGKSAKDVQVGLRCKLALRQGHWREAEELYATLHNKEVPVHKSLRAELLRQKAVDANVVDVERKAANEESKVLLRELTSTGTALLFTFDEDDRDVP